MQSNYYRNNFVQDQEELKHYDKSIRRFPMGKLLSELPPSNFHLNDLAESKYETIANVSDPIKFKYNCLKVTLNKLTLQNMKPLRALRSESNLGLGSRVTTASPSSGGTRAHNLTQVKSL